MTTLILFDDMKKFQKIDWGIKEVFYVIIVSTVITGILTIFYKRAAANSFAGAGINLIDLVIIQGISAAILISITFYFVIKRHNSGIESLGISLDNLRRGIVYGLTGGLILFIIGTTSDILVSSFIGKSPVQEMLFEMARSLKTLPALLLIGSFFAPLAEEIYFRGYAYPAFRQKYGVKLGIFGSSIYFALVHLDPLAFISITIVGIGLAYLYESSGSLIPPIFAHFVVNTLSFTLAYLRLLS